MSKEAFFKLLYFLYQLKATKEEYERKILEKVVEMDYAGDVFVVNTPLHNYYKSFEYFKSVASIVDEYIENTIWEWYGDVIKDINAEYVYYYYFLGKKYRVSVTLYDNAKTKESYSAYIDVFIE